MIRFPSVELIESQELLSALFDNSKVGLAVLDEDCCYRLVNPYLAHLNCASIESHLGKHVCVILGDHLGSQVEDAIQQVFATAKPLFNCHFEGVLPAKVKGHRLYNFFPVMAADASVSQVMATVVEPGRDVAVESVARALTSTVLRSWKEIARYAGTCVKTVQRWEAMHGFPIRRVSKNKGAVVFALQDEVDSWLRTRRLETHAAQ